MSGFYTIREPNTGSMWSPPQLAVVVHPSADAVAEAINERLNRDGQEWLVLAVSPVSETRAGASYPDTSESDHYLATIMYQERVPS